MSSSPFVKNACQCYSWHDALVTAILSVVAHPYYLVLLLSPQLVAAGSFSWTLIVLMSCTFMLEMIVALVGSCY